MCQHPSRKTRRLFLAVFATLLAASGCAESTPWEAPAPAASTLAREAAPTAAQEASPQHATRAVSLKEAIQDVFHTNRAELKACYDAVLADEPGTEGSLTLRFAIGTDGSVQDAAIDPNPLDSADLDGCLLSVVTGWTFPEQTSATAVTYPLRFSAEELAQGLPRDVVAEVIRARRPDYKDCYQAALESDPELEGDFVMSFGIAPDGTVVEPRIAETSLAHEGVEACVLGHVATLRFPEPIGGGTMRVRYPLTFTP